MTNAEKYLKEGVDIEEFTKDIFKNAQTSTLEFIPVIDEKALRRYLRKQVKPTLTEDERVILKNIKSYDTIGRTESGYLITRDRHTIPMEDDEYAYNSMYGFNHLFQFIKERRRIFY